MSVQEFLDDFLPYNQQIFSDNLFDKYKSWCLEFKHKPINTKLYFIKSLIDKGYEQKKIQMDKIRKNGFDLSKNTKVYLPDDTSLLHHIALYDKQTNIVIHDIYLSLYDKINDEESVSTELYNSKIETVEWRLFNHNNKITHDFYRMHCPLNTAIKCVKILNDTKSFDIIPDIIPNIISLCDPNYTSRFNFCN